MKEMTLKVYENGGSELQCDSGGDFERLWRKMVFLNT